MRPGMEGAPPQGVAQSQPGRSQTHWRREATQRLTDRRRRRKEDAAGSRPTAADGNGWEEGRPDGRMRRGSTL